MSSSSNQVNVNPAFVDSLGSTTDFKKALDSLDFKYPTTGITSSSFTHFLDALRSLQPGSAQVPVKVIGSFQVNSPQGWFTDQVSVNVTLTPAQNFDINDILTGFFAQFNKNIKFTNLVQFSFAFEDYLHRYYSNYALQKPALADAIRDATLQARLLAQQKYHISVTPTIKIDFARPFDFPSLSDAIAKGVTGDLQLDATSAGTIKSILPTAGTDKVGDAWFNEFLKSFPYGDGPVTYQYFFGEMAKSAKQYAVTAVLTGSNEIPDSVEQYLFKYKAIYDALFPSTDATKQIKGYNEAITDFYKKEVKKYGPYVSPSQAFADWVSYTKEKYLSTALPTDFTSLASIGAKKTLIISDIYALIASMVDSIQKVAAAQASRLLILTEWQRAYSQQLTQIPTFLEVEYPFLNSGVRADLNAQVNQKHITNMQTQQSLVSDDAKALQSNINQSNDAVSQQANMAQSLLQELNTILAAIFK